MLARTYRLRRRSDFARLYKKGQIMHAQHFSLKYQSNQEGHARLAVVVSTKVSKKAVVRNRLRRRFYAQVRQAVPQIKGGWDIVIMVRASAIETDSHTLGQELKKTLERAHILG